MKEKMLERIIVLKAIPLSELQRKYEELFGEKASSDNRAYLCRRIAYRMQELECGALSEKARNRLAELIKLYDPVNNAAFRPNVRPATPVAAKASARDKRLPIPGSAVIKNYKGKNIQVKVLENGFEYNGKLYKNLTAIAKEITGSHWNGYLFFNL